MKLLSIDVAYGRGSTGKIVRSLHHCALEHGIESSVCYGRGPVVNDSGVYKFGLDWETCLHAGLTRMTGYTGRYSHFSTKRLIRFIEDFKPDIIHMHELHAYFLDLDPFLSYLKKYRVPIVWTFHCEFMYTGKCGYAYECDKWQRECGNCPRLHEYVGTLCFDKTAQMLEEKKRLFDGLDFTIVTPSRWLASRVGESFLKDRPIHVIHNGVDTSVFHQVDTSGLRSALGISQESKIVLALAPDLMSDIKGGKHILKLAELFEGEPVTIVMVGVNNPSRYHSKPNVIMLPPTGDQSLLASYYSLADVFVICSERENYPTTCLEAQACGAPVAGFDVGGVSETIMAGGVVPYGSFDEMVRLIKSLTTEHDQSAIRADELDCDTMTRRYLKLYRQICDHCFARWAKQ